jgi:hypothetical protein
MDSFPLRSMIIGNCLKRTYLYDKINLETTYPYLKISYSRSIDEEVCSKIGCGEGIG